MLSNMKNLNFTFSKKILKNQNVYIITVPTPVDINNNPDMNALREASKLVGSVIKKDEIVIYESTVFPGATEEICVPLIEDISGLNIILISFAVTALKELIQVIRKINYQIL